MVKRLAAARRACLMTVACGGCTWWMRGHPHGGRRGNVRFSLVGGPALPLWARVLGLEGEEVEQIRRDPSPGYSE
eukprot:9312540-Alexandrium_andersonii.AAC.1